ARALGRPRLARKLLVEPGHDPQQGGFAGTVRAQDADLGVGIERQIDVLEHLAVARIGLGETLHVIDELTGHRPLSSSQRWTGLGRADLAAQRREGKRRASAGYPSFRSFRSGAAG